MKEPLSFYIDSFLTMITVEKGLAANTLEAYSRDLSRLAEFLLAQGVASWTDVRAFHLRSYVSWLRERGLQTSSIARHIVTLRRFDKFLASEGILRGEPLPELHLRPGTRKLPRTLSAEHVQSLLAQPDPSGDLGRRDQAMLELLYATGMRVSELVTLRYEQINFDGNYLIVKGKGSKVRAVPFGQLPAPNSMITSTE